MSDQLVFLATLAVLFILCTFYIANKPKDEPEPEQKTTTKSKHRRDEVIDTLDWMLVNGIIDNKQYNNLMVKCLPFIE